MLRSFFIAVTIVGMLSRPSLGVDTLPEARIHLATIKAADWVFIDNGEIRLGICKSAGAGIGWLSRSGSPENLLNHWDDGRFIQQSYYGKKDGSLWGKKPWTWNPVQGGDCQGHAAKVLELSSDKTTIHARIRPRNWAGGEMLPNCEMEETIRLEGAVAVVGFGFRYWGTEVHPIRSQEVPAAFVNPAYSTLVIYGGDQPWTGGPLVRLLPGWPNESRKISEGWAAWVNDQNTGVGIFSPIAKELTCYRFGSSPKSAGACSYSAPLVKFAITPGMHFEYNLALTLGTPEEIRAAFFKFKDSLRTPPPTTTAMK